MEKMDVFKINGDDDDNYNSNGSVRRPPKLITYATTAVPSRNDFCFNIIRKTGTGIKKISIFQPLCHLRV